MSRKPPPLPPGCPEVVAGLDLGRHGLLEASAGTGKTYAIEHLVLRLLLEKEDMELPRILVLTFTEKAAGELKEKIRARIAWRLGLGDLSPADAARLRDAHLGFDRASIHTIHGFCQRVLRNFAFENNALFRMEVVKKDMEVLEEALLEEMRSTWLTEAGEGPEGEKAFRAKAAALKLARRSKRSHWDAKLMKAAKDFNPARGDVLLPEYDPARVRQAEDDMLAAAAAIRALAPGLIPGAEADHPFLARYKTIRFESGAQQKKSPKVVEAALALAISCDPDSDREGSLERCVGFLEGLNLNAVKKSFQPLVPGPGDGGVPAWPELIALAGRLDDLRAAAKRREDGIAAGRFAELRRAVLGLRERAQAFKRARGLLGFEDMIEGVHTALRDRPDLERALRQEYRCCLVDEFQDTDPLQWSIFKRLFLDSGGTHPLFLIGDPKQAIYRFRGGDVYTYMDARGDLQALAARGEAQGRSLGTNYRSHRDMVAACNAVFVRGDWFHPSRVEEGAEAWRLPAVPDPLGYLPVLAGDRAEQEFRDGTDRPRPVIWRDFSAETRKAAVERKVCDWIIAEIRRLMADPDRLMIPGKGAGPERALGYGDICILTKTNREKLRLEKALGRAGIPFQVDKRPGLYAGEAAGQFLALLEALEEPGDAGRLSLALMTRFFRPPGEAPPARPPTGIPSWFDGWRRLADRREWQRLFHSMLYGTALLHRESMASDGDRRIMDFLHIAQNLVLEALSQGHSLPALVQRLRDLRLESGVDDEEDLHREESEGGKVILMTMHGSKGLEFPVVFLASFSGSRNPSFLKYRQGSRTVINLDAQEEEARKAYQEESDGEDRRLLYVAFTRARFKLYVPLPPAAYAKSGPAGPLGGFAAEALREAADAHPDLFFRVGDPGREADAALSVSPAEAAALPAPPAARPAAALPDPAAFFADLPAGDPYGGKDAAFSARRRRLSSYSHLVRQGHMVAGDDLEGRFDKDEVAAPAAGPGEEDLPAAAPASAPGNALPRGRETGNMFHEILEDADFAIVAAAPAPEALLEHAGTAEILGARMAEHRVEETHKGDIARVLWHTLNARIPDAAAPGTGFRLGDIAERRHEMEFLFPYPADRGYLWGFIDLVFRREGRYYLLDWKSNWLEDYGQASLERSIRESRYDLQYMLYAMALDRWLRSVKRDYDFDRHFGGIYYVYLRGMRGEAGALPVPGLAAPGAFALRPAPEDVSSAFPAALNRAMGLQASAPAASAAGAAAQRAARLLAGREEG